MISLIRKIKKIGTNELIYEKKQTHRLVVAKGEGS